MELVERFEKLRMTPLAWLFAGLAVVTGIVALVLGLGVWHDWQFGTRVRAAEHAFHRGGDHYGTATVQARAGLEVDPNALDLARIWVATAVTHETQLEQLDAALEKLEGISSDHPLGALARGIDRLRRATEGDVEPDERETLLREALEQFRMAENGELVDAIPWAGLVQILEGNPEAALQTFSGATEAIDGASRPPTYGALLALYHGGAVAHLATGQLDRAFLQARRTSSLAPDRPDSADLVARALRAWIVLGPTDDPDELARRIERAREMVVEDEYRSSLNYRGRTVNRWGFDDERKATILNAIGLAQLRAGRWSHAGESFGRASRMARRGEVPAEYHLNRGVAILHEVSARKEAGETYASLAREGAEALREAIREGSWDEATAYAISCNRAALLSDAGRESRARQAFRNIRQTYPDRTEEDGVFWWNRAVDAERSRDWREAASHFQRASRAFTGSDRARADQRRHEIRAEHPEDFR